LYDLLLVLVLVLVSFSFSFNNLISVLVILISLFNSWKRRRYWIYTEFRVYEKATLHLILSCRDGSTAPSTPCLQRWGLRSVWETPAESHRDQPDRLQREHRNGFT